MKVGVGVGVDRGNELGNTIDDNGVEEALVELTLRDMTEVDGIKTFEEAVNELEMLILKATRNAVEVEVLEEIRVGITELEKTVCSVLDVAKKFEMLITRGAVEVEVLEEIRVGTGITVELEKTVCSVLDVAKKLEEVYGNIISSLDPNPDPAVSQFIIDKPLSNTGVYIQLAISLHCYR